MPGIQSLLDGRGVSAYGIDTSNSSISNPGSNASANVKGSYTEYESALALGSEWCLLTYGRMGGVTPGTNRDALCDIAIGAATSELVIMDNVYFSRGYGQQVTDMPIPLRLPKGARLAMRAQDDGGGEFPEITLAGVHAGVAWPNAGVSPVTYGANTGDSGGTQVDPGGSANTKGSYSELTSATEREHHGLLICIGVGGNEAPADGEFLIDIGIGAATSEVVLIPDRYATTSAPDDEISPGAYFVPIVVPAGARLSARAQASITDATDRLIDVVVYGF